MWIVFETMTFLEFMDIFWSHKYFELVIFFKFTNSFWNIVTYFAFTESFSMHKHISNSLKKFKFMICNSWTISNLWIEFRFYSEIMNTFRFHETKSKSLTFLKIMNIFFESFRIFRIHEHFLNSWIYFRIYKFSRI